MSVLYSLIINVLYFLQQVVYVYSIVLAVYALLSWFPGAYQTGLGRFLSKICEPYLKLFDRLPLNIGPINFTILVALLVLDFGSNILFTVLGRLSYSLFY